MAVSRTYFGRGSGFFFDFMKIAGFAFAVLAKANHSPAASLGVMGVFGRRNVHDLKSENK